MLSLTRIFLHNWHRFHHHLVTVEDSLYLAGHNGSGKSSVLDAIGLVLVADLGRFHFNTSAQDRFSSRNLDTYVRGKIGENRYMRPAGAVAYVALEFADTIKQTSVTLGVCIEAAEGRPTERLYFILSEPLNPDQFIVNGRALPRRELRQALRGRRGARVTDQVGEYQTEMLNRLGGLNERFFDLFIKALRFEPIRDVRGFVEQWVLPERPLELETLQRVVDRLKSLRSSAQEVKTRLDHLRVVIQQQNEVLRLRNLHAQWTIVKAMLEVAAAQRNVTEIRRQLADLDEKIKQGQTLLAFAQSALEQAQAELRDAEKRLYQFAVVQRRDELQKQIQKDSAEADEIRRRWSDLRQALAREAESLRWVLQEDVLDAHERVPLSTLLNQVAQLAARPDTPPPLDLPEQIQAAIPILRSAADRVQRKRFELERQIQDLRARGKEAEAELARLRQEGRVTYRPEVERLRELIETRIGVHPPLLCELLEIPDERWQDAVEAMLGPRRFNVIVEPRFFDVALEVLEEARARERLYNVGLLDLARIQASRDARPAQPNSLALQVTTAQPALRTYIDTVLGDIITCESVQKLRQYRRAVTPQVVVYGEWTVRAVPPGNYRPWFIGARAQHSQIENYERLKRELGDQWAALVPQEQVIAQQVERLQRWANWSALLPRFDQPLDERPLRAQIAEAESELRSLDLSGVAVLEQEVTRLKEIVKREGEEERRLDKQIDGWLKDKNTLIGQAEAAQRELDERQQLADEVRARYPEVLPAAEEQFAERAALPDLNEAIRNAVATAARLQTQAENERAALIQEATGYNTRYQFAARVDDADEPRYEQEEQRLVATELPRYEEQIAQSQREAEDELREHVLHRLREQIQNAKTELYRLNEALSGHDFRGKRYRFQYHPAEDLREFYDLIMGTEVLGAGSLFESQFYRDHQAAFDRFYATLISTPQNDGERIEQARMTDYRRYLSYDIEVMHADGQMSRLSRTMDQMSGGEVQTPFYLAIAASFVQLYRINERSGRPTIRLIVFDEAFSKMDQDHIGSTLELFQHFKLQIVTATPLERCEYLVPKMCTSLVLTGVGDTVLIEPYRNYAAKIESMYEA